MSDAAASVFISYSHADSELARALATALRERGLRVWIDEGSCPSEDPANGAHALKAACRASPDCDSDARRDERSRRLALHTPAPTP